jgi:hypothetical protein
VVSARTLLHLWNAHSGAEIEQSAARKNGDNSLVYLLNEQCCQIQQWKDLVEHEISFLMAHSLQGAIVQLAIVADGLNKILERLQTAEDRDLQEELLKVQRHARSASDAVLDELGQDYEPVRKIVETYAHLGDLDPNWLNMIDSWAEQGSLELDGKLKAEVAA